MDGSSMTSMKICALSELGNKKFWQYLEKTLPVPWTGSIFLKTWKFQVVRIWKEKISLFIIILLKEKCSLLEEKREIFKEQGKVCPKGKKCLKKKLKYVMLVEKKCILLRNDCVVVCSISLHITLVHAHKRTPKHNIRLLSSFERGDKIWLKILI